MIVQLKYVTKIQVNRLDNRLNVKDNVAKMWNNRLQDNFVGKNVANLS